MARKFVAPVAATLLAIPICAYADQRSGKVDQLFSRWNTSPTSIPGMNIAVWRDGKRIYSRSFGMANLEFSQPNDAKLVYPIGSISKQFVGYCIQLLASEGKLALGDDARLYLPELHDFGEKITLQMLLNHTSGVRDSVSLLIAKGRRVDDVVSEKESFNIVTRQTGLNFRPGTRYRYSNGNYVLLAKVVERVSGMPFGVFLQEHVFQPLGMTHTSVVGEPVGVTANRAYGYSGDKPAVPRTASDSTYGNTGILSTIDDLAIWSAQFYEPGTLSPAVFAAMKTPGVLNDGIPITYASGLHVEAFHDIPYVEHTGQVPGFHSDLLVFPKKRLSIILLANDESFEAAKFAFAIAEIYLQGETTRGIDRPLSVRQPAQAILKSYSGTYELLSGTSLIGPGRRLTFVVSNGALRLNDEKFPLLASSDHDFYSEQSSLRVRFSPLRGGNGSWMVVVHDSSGTDFAGRRVDDVSRPEKPITALPPMAYAGLYYSTDLDTVYTVLVRGKGLILRTPRGEVPMVVHSGDTCDARGNLMEGEVSGMLEFTRSGSTASGFVLTVSGARAANIQFYRINSAIAQ